MKVYVVTSGSYSDYHIDAVFTDPVMAKSYANLGSGREVEEYEADSVKIATSGIKARIWYDPKKNEITMIDTGDFIQNRWRPYKDEYYMHELRVERKLSARTLEDIKKHGVKSPLLLKSMQDAWAQYKAEHMDDIEYDEDEEVWIRATPEEAAKMFKGLAEMYNIMFASTSSDCNINGGKNVD